MTFVSDSALVDGQSSDGIAPIYWSQPATAQASSLSGSVLAWVNDHQEDILTCTSAPELRHPQPQQPCDWEDVLSLMSSDLPSSGKTGVPQPTLDTVCQRRRESPDIGPSIDEETASELIWRKSSTLAYSTPISNYGIVDQVKCEGSLTLQPPGLSDDLATVSRVADRKLMYGYPHLLSPTLSEPDEESLSNAIMSDQSTLDWNLSSDIFTISPPPDPETPLLSSPLPEVDQGAIQLTSENQFLVRSRLSGMSYKQIREEGQFRVSESTLRGRYRCLTKAPQCRLRRPQWSEKDVELLLEAIGNLISTNDEAPHKRLDNHSVRITSRKMPWKKVADYISDKGGYQFGSATCRRKWEEICASRRRPY